MKRPDCPAMKVPTMLAMPTTDSAVGPTQDGSPWSMVKAGRCTMMKATWKPHTKKPAVSSQKLG